MSNDNPKFVFVISTAGSVMKEVLKQSSLRSRIHSIVVEDGAPYAETWNGHGIPEVHMKPGSNDEFCDRLLEYLRDNAIDYILSFYTQFYSRRLRARYTDRIVNFHPSLLPAFKGMDGFGDGIRYHAKLIGTTVELIKDVMDEGKIVMQTVFPADPGKSLDELRHLLFVQQCKTLLQTVEWIAANRLAVEGDKVTISDAEFSDLEFAPALDSPVARSLDIPFSG